MTAAKVPTDSPLSPRGWLRASLLSFTLGLAMCVGMLTVFALGVLAPFLVADLHLTAGSVGLLSAMLFAVGAIASPTAGRLVDVLDGKRVLYLLFVVMGAAWTGMAAAPSFAALLPVTALAGVAMALAYPVTMRLVMQYEGDRALLLGIAQSGSPVGSLFAGFVLPSTAFLFGWRGAMLAMVTLCAVGIIATAPIRGWVGHNDAEGPATWPPRVLWLTLYAFLMNVSSTSTIIYLPLYAYEELGLSAKASGLITAISGAISIIGRILWPRVLRRRSSVGPALGTLGGIAAVSTMLVIVASPSHSSLLLWLGVAGLGASAMSWVSLTMSAILVEVEVLHSGRVAGRVMGYSLFGAAAGPLVFGWVVESNGEFLLSWIGIFVTFAVAAIGSVYWHFRRVAT